MALFPADPDRLDYTESPWTNPEDGRKWIYKPHDSVPMWWPYTAPGTALTWAKIEALDDFPPDLGGGTTLTSYVDQIESLADYPATFPADHAAATVTGNGISITGQQISLDIGTGATQVAAGDHGHATLSGTTLSGGTISGATTVAAGTTWSYNSSTEKTAHLSALGAGATGILLLGAATAAAARETLELKEYVLRRTTDATARTNDTQAADDQIVIPELTAGKHYVVEYVLPISTAGSGGFKAIISGIDAMAANNTAIGRVMQSSSSSDILLGSDTLIALRNSVTTGTSIQGAISFVAATTHTPIFKWAQNTTDGTNTVLKASAVIVIRER